VHGLIGFDLSLEDAPKAAWDCRSATRAQKNETLIVGKKGNKQRKGK